MKKNRILILAFIFVSHVVQGATFTVQNSSWRDIFVKPFWLSTTPLTYVKLPAGKSLSFNSGIKSVEKISWITDQPNDNTWVEYEVSNPQSGKILDALKVSRQFRIYPDVSCEHNFGSSAVVQKATKRPADYFWVGNLEVHLHQSGNPFLVVENTTNDIVLVAPPFNNIPQAERGLTSSGLDCIAPGGSRIYYVGKYIPQTSGASLNTNNMRCMKKNPDNQAWYYSEYTTTNINNSGSSRTLPGKIQILDNGTIRYKLSYNGNIFDIKPKNTALVPTPVQCQ